MEKKTLLYCGGMLIQSLLSTKAFCLDPINKIEKIKKLHELYTIKESTIQGIKKESGIINLSEQISAIVENLRKKNLHLIESINNLSKNPSYNQQEIASLQKEIESNKNEFRNKDGKNLLELENALRSLQNITKNIIKEKTLKFDTEITDIKNELALLG